MAVRRGAAADRDAVRGAHAWAYMRRDPDYFADWSAHAVPPRYEDADILLRVQGEADLLAAAEWGLLAWEDPAARAWRSPFWSAIPMLIGEPDPDPWPDPAPLLAMLAGAGARVEGLRLRDGRFVLKAELGNALLQIMVPSGRAFAPGDGIARHRDGDVIPAVIDGNRCGSPGSAMVWRSRGIRGYPDRATPTCHPGRCGEARPGPDQGTIRGPARRGPCGLRRQHWAPARRPGRQCGP